MKQDIIFRCELKEEEADYGKPVANLQSAADPGPKGVLILDGFPFADLLRKGETYRITIEQLG